MSKVIIKIVTPVHIGSGNFLRHNIDFVTWSDNDGSYIGILDPNKMLSMIGVNNIDYWVSIIENEGDTKDFMKKKGNCDNPEKYVKRIIFNSAKVERNDTLKECIHDGMGRAYIPGSSIKGAIRTALLATLTANTHADIKRLINIKHINASKIEQSLFGNDPNNDIFRFLQVGDALFEESEIASRVINLNIRRQKNLLDRSKSQIVESIWTEDEACTQIKINTRYYDWVKERCNNRNLLGNMPTEIRELSSLFRLINCHTQNLIKDEIEYWEEIGKDYEGTDEYIEKMQSILNHTNNCKNGECILRLGHASGWRFITGAWSEKLENFYSDIVPKIRPHNDRYLEYDFPKTRRIDEDQDIFGFIKLSLCK